MTAMQAIDLFLKQVERRSGLKALLVPSALPEPGLHAKVALRKLVPVKDTRAGLRGSGAFLVRLSAAIESRLESDIALGEAVHALESFLRWSVTADRLEDAAGNPVPNTSLQVRLGDDDGVIEDPDDDKVAWLREELIFEVHIPGTI